MPKVSVCSPVSRHDTLSAFIQSIICQSFTDWELITVGQGDFENINVQKIYGIVSEISSRDYRVKYIHIDQKGCSRARNAAIQAATGEIIVVIDDDAEAAPDLLEKIVLFFFENPDIDFYGGAVKKPPKKFWRLGVCPSVDPLEAVYDPGSEKVPPAGWNWIGCNHGMRKEVFDMVGPYDEFLDPGSVFPAAGDVDYMLRLEAFGIKMASKPDHIVYHTYGYRYGLKAFIRHQYNYAYGNGGLAAKLVLAGDPRGQDWVRYSKRERLLGWIKPFRPHRLIRGLYGWFVFKSAYDRCLREFRVESNLLVLR